MIPTSQFEWPSSKQGWGLSNAVESMFSLLRLLKWKPPLGVSLESA